MTRDELIALAKQCGAEEFYNEPNKLAVNGQVLEAFTAALSSATPAGGGLTLPKSYASSTVTSTLYGHAHVSFHFDDPQEAEAWHDQVISSHALAASPEPAGGGLMAEIAEFDAFLSMSSKDATPLPYTLVRMFVNRLKSLAASPVPMSDTGAQEVLSDDALRIIGECRDAFPAPEHNTRLDELFVQAIGSPEDVPAYLRAIASSIASQPSLQAAIDALSFQPAYAPAANYLRSLPTPPQSAPQEAQAVTDPTDPGYDVAVLREHVRHLERRIRQLHAPQASQSTPGEAVATYNGQDADATAELLACLDGLNHGTKLYTHPDTTHSAPVAGMTEPVPIGELVALRRNAKRYKVLRDGRHGFNAYRLAPKTGKRWRGYGDEGDILKGDELDKQVDNAIEAALREKAGGKA